MVLNTNLGGMHKASKDYINERSHYGSEDAEGTDYLM